jgi:hypothetical protein
VLYNCVHCCRTYSGDYIRLGIGLTTGFIGSQSVTQLGYSVLCFTTHNRRVSSVPLKTPDPVCNQLLRHPLPSLVITDSELSHHVKVKVTLQPTTSWSVSPFRRPSYIAREQTTKKTPSPIPILLYDVITGTDPKENDSSSNCCVA